MKRNKWKTFSRAPLGPGCRWPIGRAVVFVASAIAGFPAHPPKGLKFLYSTSVINLFDFRFEWFILFSSSVQFFSYLPVLFFVAVFFSWWEPAFIIRVAFFFSFDTCILTTTLDSSFSFSSCKFVGSDLLCLLNGYFINDISSTDPKYTRIFIGCSHRLTSKRPNKKWDNFYGFSDVDY